MTFKLNQITFTVND